VAFTAFAIVAPGLESLAVDELRALGVADAAPEHGGVNFSASERRLARALVSVRTVTRIVVRVAEFRAVSFAQLEHEARTVAWARWIRPGGRAQFRVTCRKSRLYHSDAVAERLERAAADAVRGVTFGARDATDDTDGRGDTNAEAAQLFVVRMTNDVCTISADAAGAPLYQRGYRTAVAKAPLRETLAAAMLAGADWNPATALVDPMCGSGTLVIEAARRARRMAPGLARAFAAERWPSSTTAVWTDVRGAAAADVRPRAGPPICGSDRDPGAIAAANANAVRAGVEANVEFAVLSLSSVRAPATDGLLITNPPYGVRVGDSRTLRDLYARFGRLAREEFAGWRCALLSADRTRGHVLERQLGLDLCEVWRSSNGGIPVRLLAGESVRTRSQSPR
jgi:putative N6-adenine-specific DNA methylase